jgi:hypothetical protein
MKNVFSGDSASKMKSASDSVDGTFQYYMKILTKDLKTRIQNSQMSNDVLKNFLESMKKLRDEIQIKENKQIMKIFNTQIIENITSLYNDNPLKIKEDMTKMRNLMTNYENVFQNVFISDKDGTNEQQLSLHSAFYIIIFLSKITLSVEKLLAKRDNDLQAQALLKEKEQKLKTQYNDTLQRIEAQRKAEIQVIMKKIYGKNGDRTLDWYGSPFFC